MTNEADGSREALDDVRRTATALLAVAKGALRRILVSDGVSTVELEWQDAPPAGHPADVIRMEGAPEDPSPTSDLYYVTAPMVGTFYHSPEPDAPPFVQVGDIVEQGRQVGIVEAMKLMNAVESDHAGKVVALLVANAAPVEYDEPLLALAPVIPQ